MPNKERDFLEAGLGLQKMPNTFNLLGSPGGIDLVPEICLRIAEHAIDEDPKAAAVLLSVSKVSDHLPASESLSY